MLFLICCLDSCINFCSRLEITTSIISYSIFEPVTLTFQLGLYILPLDLHTEAQVVMCVCLVASLVTDRHILRETHNASQTQGVKCLLFYALLFLSHSSRIQATINKIYTLTFQISTASSGRRSARIRPTPRLTRKDSVAMMAFNEIRKLSVRRPNIL